MARGRLRVMALHRIKLNSRERTACFDCPLLLAEMIYTLLRNDCRGAHIACVLGSVSAPCTTTVESCQETTSALFSLPPASTKFLRVFSLVIWHCSGSTRRLLGPKTIIYRG